VPPTAVVGNVSVVGTIRNVSVVPDSEIVPELCPLIVKLVVAKWGPAVCGTKVYVTTHDAPAARVTPEQACTAEKLGSPGAPPAMLRTWGDVARFVTTTSIPADELPTVVVGNARVVGEIEKPSVAVPDRKIVPEL
jgi:hypothetical protein